MSELFDKWGKDTGPGKTREQVVRQNGIVVIVDLYNYNIDGNVLKDEHKKQIDDKLLPLLRDFPMHVKLRGTASKSGDSEYNRQLSLGRVLRIKKYLTERGIPESKAPGPDIQAAGEDLSTSDSQEDEQDRAVRITVAMGIKPRPIYPTIVLPEIVITSGPPPPTQPPPPIIIRPPMLKKIPINVSQNWQIRQLSQADVEFIVGLSGMAFQIVDRTNNEEIICVMPAAGAGIGLPASLTLKGPWNIFTTPKPIRITDFAGPATWTTVFSTGPFSHNTLEVNDTRVPPIRVATGVTIGASGPTVVGGILFCSSPRPFGGP